MNNAGYNPEIIPIRNGDKNNGTNTCNFIKMFKERTCPESLLSHGSEIYNKPNAIKMPAQVIKTDSLRNCKINSLFLAPTTFLIPISLARKADRAVERFM